jgi:hypothetical protein
LNGNPVRANLLVSIVSSGNLVSPTDGDVSRLIAGSVRKTRTFGVSDPVKNRRGRVPGGDENSLSNSLTNQSM